MSSTESWDFTPREFSARQQVFQEYREQENRWRAIAWVHTLNAPHFHKKNEQAYTLDDFILSDQGEQRKIQAERDRVDLMREKAFDDRISVDMKKKDFDDSWLPGWARMTPEEKQERGRA